MNKISFNDFYNKYIEFAKPLITSLEEERVNNCNKLIGYIKSYFLVVFAISTIVLLFINIKLEINTMIFIIGALFTMISASYIVIAPLHFFTNIYPKTIKDFKYLLKRTILPNLCSYIGNIEWDSKNEERIYSDSVISDEDITNSGLEAVNSITKYVDDRFIGRYNNINFNVEEVLSGVGPRTIFIKFSTNKKITNRVIISPKSSLTEKNNTIILLLIAIVLLLYLVITFYSFESLDIATKIKSILGIIMVGGIIYCKDEIFPQKTLHKDEKLKTIILEDVEFNKKYNVYCSDEVEARYLVTTAFMKRFYDLKTAFKSNSVKCSFFGDYIMFAINTNHDVFEMGSLFSSLKDSLYLHTFYNELTSIYKLIDYFKIDEKTGL